MASEYQQELEIALVTLQEHEEYKKDVIKKLARLLEKGDTPKDLISSVLHKDLKGYVTAQYINAILKEEQIGQTEKQQRKTKLAVTATNDNRQLEQSSDDLETSFNNDDKKEPETSTTILPPTTTPDLEPSTNFKEYNDLPDRYNEALEKIEAVEAHNEYLKEQVSELQTAVKVLDEALKAKPLVQATTANEKSAIAMTDEGRRNPNRGYWVRFDLSNVEITRPLINIIMRMKDRPKQFFVEVLGEDVVEVSETKL